MNPQILHLEFIESKDEKVHPQVCGLMVYFCLG
jgi:hypothetical protein